MEIKVKDPVRIKSNGLSGVVHILEGVPVRKAWVEVFPGAQKGYIYMNMYDWTLGTSGLLALNVYNIDDLEIDK